MAFKLSELENGLGEVLASITSKKPMVLMIEKKEDYQIWVEADCLHLVEYGLNVYGAEYCKFKSDTDTYEVDHDLIYIFDADTGLVLYSEYGSSLEVCLINFFREAGIKVNKVEDVLCTYTLDTGDFIREKVLKYEKRKNKK